MHDFTYDDIFFFVLFYTVVMSQQIFVFICLQITPKVPEDVYRTCQFDILFANEATAYTDIIPALGHVENFPKYY